jgi:hypothetical protein
VLCAFEVRVFQKLKTISELQKLLLSDLVYYSPQCLPIIFIIPYHLQPKHFWVSFKALYVKQLTSYLTLKIALFAFTSFLHQASSLTLCSSLKAQISGICFYVQAAVKMSGGKAQITARIYTLPSNSSEIKFRAF